MTIEPQNFEEKLVWYTIVGTYGLYLIGAQYVWVPIVAIVLTIHLCKKLWNQTDWTPPQEKITIPAAVWIWIVAMIAIEVALVMAHLDFELGWAKTFFSTMNSWARSWALMALFPLIGCLKIRPQIIYRAACILCLQSLFVAIFAFLLYVLNLPDLSYTSPLLIFKGSHHNYSVNLFDVGGDLGEARQLRLLLFANFANNLGLVGNVYFFLASQESERKWRMLGMIGAVAMVVGSGSRSTVFSLALIPIITWFVTNFSWPLQIAAGIVSCITGMIAPQLIDFADNTWSKAIKGYRGSSALVRKRLHEVAMNRWTEAPIWGHGVVAEKGPKYTEHMPIGSHNQWPDLLYVRGAVGFTVFLVAMLWSSTTLLIKAQTSAVAKTALSIYLAFWIATAAVDIETSAYLYWPGLILTGMAFKEEQKTIPNPFRSYKLS